MVQEGLKYDGQKLAMGLVPPSLNRWVAAVLTYGRVKYAAWNWMHVDNASDRYYDAALRHLDAWREADLRNNKRFLDPAQQFGVELHSDDGESGLPHLAHAITCLAFILEQEVGPLQPNMRELLARAYAAKEAHENATNNADLVHAADFRTGPAPRKSTR